MVIEICQAIIAGRSPPYDGARAIWRDAWPLLSDAPELDQLGGFVGAVSEWDDHPEVSAEIEAEIMTKARDILVRWASTT